MLLEAYVEKEKELVAIYSGCTHKNNTRTQTNWTTEMKFHGIAESPHSNRRFWRQNLKAIPGIGILENGFFTSYILSIIQVLHRRDNVGACC